MQWNEIRLHAGENIKNFKNLHYQIRFYAFRTQVKAAIAQVVAKFEISIDKCVPDQMKHPEAFLISPLEFLNVPYHKLYLNFKQLDKLN